MASEVAYWVRDVEEAVRFYQEALGFELRDHAPGRHAFLEAGDCLLVLFNREEPGTALGEEYLARTGGPRGEVYHVAFRVAPELLDAAGAELRSRGIEVKGPVEFATGRRSWFFEDPDGHYVELTDR
jgi:catechol 2,3-dioxygenase-like lactoylglutathione lyase family enzyme